MHTYGCACTSVNIFLSVSLWIFCHSHAYIVINVCVISCRQSAEWGKRPSSRLLLRPSPHTQVCKEYEDVLCAYYIYEMYACLYVCLAGCQGPTHKHQWKTQRTRFATVAVILHLASRSTEGAKWTVYRSRSLAARMWHDEICWKIVIYTLYICNTNTIHIRQTRAMSTGHR